MRTAVSIICVVLCALCVSSIVRVIAASSNLLSEDNALTSAGFEMAVASNLVVLNISVVLILSIVALCCVCWLYHILLLRRQSSEYSSPTGA